MKKLVLIIAALQLFTSCKKVDSLTQFHLDYTSSVVIPSSAGINLPLNLFTPKIESNSESEFAVNDTKKDLIEEIILTQLDLTITSPTGGDFGFLKSIEVYISAEGLSEIMVASNTDIPDNAGAKISLTPTNKDLKEYIKKDKFNLRLNYVTDEVLTSDYHIDVYTKFFVDAEILGQ